MRLWLSITIGLIAFLLNVSVYFWLPLELFVHLRTFGYLGAFSIAAVANASVILPIPYYPVIARLAQVLNVWGVILSAAFGSAVGETVAFFPGRTGRGVVKQTRVNNWIGRQMQKPWRGGLLLFAFSAPPNPAFDIAGLVAGAVGFPFWLFLSSVFLGRIVRMSLVAFAGLTLDWI
jgi:membrane protein YqaA with SNARE-associated domain